ncbi:GNAT family N-acetyltransferase [Streptomyces sp. NPDC049541]|uniref:GNAT family N-acetyltransferase n=1 Tax=Streptomyces sp. NPDC049541 TaxID=3365594 RepID=UPI0037ACDF6C
MLVENLLQLVAVQRVTDQRLPETDDLVLVAVATAHAAYPPVCCRTARGQPIMVLPLTCKRRRPQVVGIRSRHHETPSNLRQGMTVEDVLSVLTLLRRAEADVWIGGGWGIPCDRPGIRDVPGGLGRRSGFGRICDRDRAQRKRRCHRARGTAGTSGAGRRGRGFGAYGAAREQSARSRRCCRTCPRSASGRCTRRVGCGSTARRRSGVEATGRGGRTRGRRCGRAGRDHVARVRGPRTRSGGRRRRNRIWPGRTVHISAPTAPPARGRGFGRATGSATVAHALAAGLLPRWRARRTASRRVAAALGFAELGAQLSIETARQPGP